MVALRQVRAVALMVGAVVAIGVVSLGYLRPAAAAQRAHAAQVPRVDDATWQWTEPRVVQAINLVKGPDGAYFVWTNPGGGTGGHS